MCFYGVVSSITRRHELVWYVTDSLWWARASDEEVQIVWKLLVVAPHRPCLFDGVVVVSRGVEGDAGHHVIILHIM